MPGPQRPSSDPNPQIQSNHCAFTFRLLSFSRTTACHERRGRRSCFDVPPKAQDILGSLMIDFQYGEEHILPEDSELSSIYVPPYLSPTHRLSRSWHRRTSLKMWLQPCGIPSMQWAMLEAGAKHDHACCSPESPEKPDLVFRLETS